MGREMFQVSLSNLKLFSIYDLTHPQSSNGADPFLPGANTLALGQPRGKPAAGLNPYRRSLRRLTGIRLTLPFISPGGEVELFPVVRLP